MAVNTLSEDLDNLYTTTWQNMKSEAADQILDAVPFWFWLREHDALDPVPGGRFLTEPLRYAKSDNIRWIKKGSSMPLSDKEFLTEAIFQWRYVADSIVRYGIDDHQNRGRNEIMSLAQAKMDMSRDSLTDEMEIALFGTNSAAAGETPFNNLTQVVPDDPTAGVSFGGIDPSVYTWWQSQTIDFATDYTTFVADGDTAMRRMLNDCSQNRGQDRPDLILTAQQVYEDYEAIAVGDQQIVNQKLADVGFTFQQYKGIPMLWSPQCLDRTATTDGRMYFLNSRFLRLKYDPEVFFDMTRWKEIPAQVNDRAAQIVTAGNLTTGRRKVHGVIHSIDS